MILFIRKVFCFISLIILIICLFISLFFTFYKTPNTPRKKIFLGDSTSKASIDTKIAKEYENYSQGGEAYLFTYFKLKRLNETQKLDTILINFSPLNIINNEFEKAGVSGRQRYLPIIESEGHIDLFKNNPIIYLKSWLELGKDFLSFYNERRISFGGFTANKTNGYNENYYAPKKNFSISSYQKKYLSKIVDFSKKNNIYLIFVNLPKYTEDKNYSNYNQDMFFQFYNENYSHIDFINLSSLHLQKQRGGVTKNTILLI